MNSRLGKAAFCALVLVLGASTSAPAQDHTALSSAEVGQIVDAVLDGLLPPGKRVSRVEVWKRTIAFDRVRTLVAFSLADAPLPVQRQVSPGSDGLLADCRQARRSRCAGLGWRIYVRVEPVSIGKGEALVRAYVVWADRGTDGFDEALAQNARASLVGYLADVYLARDESGIWVFVRQGRTLVG